MLNRITFTGLDDQTNIDNLVKLEAKYPELNIEWGILFSSWVGRNRYPKPNKINEAVEKLKNCAAHLCGQIFDKTYIEAKLPDTRFGRVQLNFNSKGKQVFAPRLSALFSRYPKIEFILQYNISNKPIIDELLSFKHLDANWGILFDASGGRGKELKEIPEPISILNCGYAGGIGPQNIQTMIEQITKRLGDRPFDIDMEGNIRTDDRFDEAKVEQCLEIAKNYVKSSSL